MTDEGSGFAYPPEEYICWDPLSVLEPGYKNLDTCSWRGMITNGPNADFLNTFIEDINQADSRANPLTDLKWSDELALSASWFLQDMDGCHVIPDQIVDD